MEAHDQQWKGIIRELYGAFDRADAERRLLRQIDRAIIRSEDGEHGPSDDRLLLQDLIVSSVSTLSEIYGLAAIGGCYLFSGGLLLKLQPVSNHDFLSAPSDTTVTLPEELAITPALHGALETPLGHGDIDAVVLTRGVGAHDPIFDELERAETVLAYPLAAMHGVPIGLLLFVDTQAREGSRLASPEFLLALHGLAQQLSIAYTHSVSAARERAMSRLWDLFLSSDLGPRQCFRTLAHEVPNFLPDLGPLRIAEPPGVQILVLDTVRTADDKPLLLHIRGATRGTTSSGTKVSVSESISGLLIEHTREQMDYFCADPSESRWEGRYKNYLGAGRADPIQTELAVRLDADGETIGVLNLESTHQEAFNAHHVRAMLDLADRLAPMVTVFEERIRHNSLMHRSVSATTATYLDSLAGVFRHGIKTPLLALRGDIDLLEKITARDMQHAVDADARNPQAVASVLSALERLRAESIEVSVFATEFLRNISGFGKAGAFNLQELVATTVALARESRLAQDPAGIRFDITGDEDATAFCTPLLKQHLFCIFNNAISSIQERLEEDPSDGLIEVVIERPPELPADQEVELNRGWVVRIRDNGVGVSPDQLEALRTLEGGVRFRKSGGEGLGLLAARRYLASIGGFMTLDGSPGTFEVGLLLDEYQEDIHGPLSTDD